MATHKKDTRGARVLSLTTPTTDSAAAHNQEAPGAVVSPPTTPPSEFTAMHKQETPVLIAQMSATSATDYTRARETEAQGATASNSTIARTGSHNMASQAIPSDPPSLTTTMTTNTDSSASRLEPTLGARRNDKLEEGEIPTSEDEVRDHGSPSNMRWESCINAVDISDKCFQFAPLSDNHTRAEQLEQNDIATTRNITSSHSFNESEPLIPSLHANKRYRSNRGLRIGYVVMVPQLELLGNMSLTGEPGNFDVGGEWNILKKRPVAIAAFIGNNKVVGHRMTTFSGTDPIALPRKMIEEDSYGKRRLLLSDYVQLIADHYPGKGSIQKMKQCHNKGETQLHWSGRDPLREKVCFLSLIETFTFA